MAEESNMSFLQHLEELRWRLVRSAIAVIVFGTVIWFYQEKIMNQIFLKMIQKDFITFRIMCKLFGICIDDIPVKMQSMTVSGQFSYALMLSIMGGVVLAFPFIFYQIWAFVKPGLKFT